MCISGGLCVWVYVLVCPQNLCVCADEFLHFIHFFFYFLLFFFVTAHYKCVLNEVKASQKSSRKNTSHTHESKELVRFAIAILTGSPELHRVPSIEYSSRIDYQR